MSIVQAAELRVASNNPSKSCLAYWSLQFWSVFSSPWAFELPAKMHCKLYAILCLESGNGPWNCVEDCNAHLLTYFSVLDIGITEQVRWQHI